MKIEEPIYLEALVEMPNQGFGGHFLKTFEDLKDMGYNCRSMSGGKDETLLLFVGNKPYLPSDAYHKEKMAEDVLELMDKVPEVEKVYVVTKYGKSVI